MFVTHCMHMRNAGLELLSLHGSLLQGLLQPQLHARYSPLAPVKVKLPCQAMKVKAVSQDW